MRIVYAEDDAVVRANVAMLLVTYGVDVHEARDGGEALALCRAFRPKLVVLDLQMPEIDGFETARRIRELEEGARTRLIALTGQSSVQARRDAELAGFDEILIKPVSASRLMQALGLRQSDSSA
jgi:CheY-like chemotaxis protein